MRSIARRNYHLYTLIMDGPKVLNAPLTNTTLRSTQYTKQKQEKLPKISHKQQIKEQPNLELQVIKF
jgi:hypothetical protein